MTHLWLYAMLGMSPAAPQSISVPVSVIADVEPSRSHGQPFMSRRRSHAQSQHATASTLQRRAALFLYAGLLSVLCLACNQTEGAPRGSQDDAPPPTPVQTITLEPRPLAHTISAVGGLESPQTTLTTADRGGKIVFLDIPEGQEVQRGHVLARIDPDEAQAAVDMAEARYRNAQTTLARLETLPAKARSQQALDDTQAAVLTTKGALDEAKTVLRKMTIRAPFTGRLGLRKVSLGAYLEPGDAVVRLTQVRPLHLVFSLPQHYVAQLETGQTVRGVAGSCASRFTATISVIDPFLNPETRSVTVQAIVPNEDGSLLPGMAVALQLEVANVSNALSVPLEAIIRQGTKRLVYTVQADNLVAARPVRLGQFARQQVEVMSGLQPGERVVVAGHQKLRPGMRVQTTPYEPIENANLELGAGTALLAECNF